MVAGRLDAARPRHSKGPVNQTHMPNTTNKNDKKAANTKAMAGVDAHLSGMPTIVLNGQQYTPTSLKAVFQQDNAAIVAAESAHKALNQSVLDERTTHASTAKVTRALRSFILGYFGEAAVAIIGDFGFNAPKPKAVKTAATKALAVAKADATRKARGTRGSVQKLDVSGGVTTVVVSQSGSGAKLVPNPATGPAPVANAPAAPAAAASAEPAPVATPGATPAAPKA